MTSTTDESVQDQARAFDAVYDQVRALNEKLVETAKSTGNTSLDAYEKALSGFVALQRQTVGATRLDWVNNVVTAQTTFLTEISSAWTTAAREVLK